MSGALPPGEAACSSVACRAPPDLDEVPFQPRQGITSADQVVLNRFQEPFTFLGC